MEQIIPGILYLVATPIGNLEDITLRALRILREVELIAAEDTRHTIKLLNHFEIKTPLTSYHEHNKFEKGKSLINQLLEGKSIALVTDAGTPGISDPGEELVYDAAQSGIEVTAVPGPVAAISGLIVSGLPTGRFVFEGFLPMNKRVRKEHIQSLKNEVRTLIFYEAPHKLIYTLKDLYSHFGERKIVLTRELTKKFEEKVRCLLSEAIEKYSVETPRGEFVLIMEGCSQQDIDEIQNNKWSDISISEHVSKYVDAGMTKKEAIKKVAEDRGVSKRDVYNEVTND